VNLADYVKQKGAGAIRKLSEASGVSEHTIRAVARGMKLSLYPKALALSKATGGAVPVESMLAELEEK
jgi:DeoR/GlpR family transcriptional regulator of sugar metabolism